MGAKPKHICLHCPLPIYAKRLCRRHYKKMIAIKNDQYKKDYLKRKQNPAFMEKKRMLDQIYREKKKRGIDTSRKTNDNSLVNQDWQAYAKKWRKNTGYDNYRALKLSVEYHKRREEIISHYSNGKNCCAGCGFADIRVLEIDHINDDGSVHRKEMGHLTPVWWIIKNNFPPGFQILCRNCNGLKELLRRDMEFIRRNNMP